RIDQYHATIRGALVGANQELVADVVDDPKAVVSNLGDDWCELNLTFRNVAVEKRVAFLSFAAFGDAQDREALVFSGVDALKPLRMVLVFVNQHVSRLRRADFVEIDSLKLVDAAQLFALRRFGIATVVEAVALPRHSRGLHPLDLVRKLVATRDFHDVERDPVRTAFGDAIREILAIGRE